MKKSDVKRLDPKVYMLHSVMKNHIGKNNAIHATKLANLLGIDKRTLRLLRAEHNSSNSEFDNLILSFFLFGVNTFWFFYPLTSKEKRPQWSVFSFC